MICAWKELLGILPLWLRDQVDRQGREDLCELRLRIDAPPELITGRGSILLEVGSCGNTLEEAENAVLLFAQAYASLLKENLK